MNKILILVTFTGVLGIYAANNGTKRNITPPPNILKLSTTPFCKTNKDCAKKGGICLRKIPGDHFSLLSETHCVCRSRRDCKNGYTCYWTKTEKGNMPVPGCVELSQVSQKDLQFSKGNTSFQKKYPPKKEKLRYRFSKIPNNGNLALHLARYFSPQIDCHESQIVFLACPFCKFLVRLSITRLVAERIPC